MVGRAGGLSELTLDKEGAELHPELARDCIAKLKDLFDALPPAAGHRLHPDESLRQIIAPVERVAKAKLGSACRPVRAIAFDKSESANWAIGWHQDRTICVKKRAEVDGFGPWTTKQGWLHVEPPFEITARMLTARIHLDAVDESNAPLRIALSSHRLGKISDASAEKGATQCEILECYASPGDVWLYSTPILHASQRAEPGRRRRVLQVDFSASVLPRPLAWTEISRGY